MFILIRLNSCQKSYTGEKIELWFMMFNATINNISVLSWR